MKVLVYVEGPGDRASLEKVFRPTLEQARKAKVSITFHPCGGKDWILQRLGRTAANHFQSNPADYIFAVPDLYPMAKYSQTGEAHRSFEELKALLESRFRNAADEFRLTAAVRAHYRIHCFKHDLEVLLLGVPNVLRLRLGTDENIEKNWCRPPENQNDHKPPKYVIKELFNKYKHRSYNETTDAPWILERASAKDLCGSCPQNFKPLFTELDRLSRGESLE